jgi:fermentation-respiration switch protein FrsA (DUF1100 family)
MPGKSGVISTLLRIILLGITGYGLIVIFLFFWQDRMVYYPMKQMEGTPADVGLHYREIELVTPDGVRLSAWYVGTGNTQDVLLFCHGNAGNISHRLKSLSIFHNLGLNILLFDYRGYGKSGGKPSEQGTYLDAETAWRYLVEKEKIPAERILLFGRSLGGAVAAYLASKVNARALILESTFTSIPDVGAEAYPFFPVRLLSRYRYNTLELLPGITIPVLVVHSPDDEIISFDHGKSLFEAANEPKYFLNIFGGHNVGFTDSGSIYTDGLKEFLARL